MGIMDAPALTLEDLQAAIRRAAQAAAQAPKARSLMDALAKMDQQFNSGSAHPPRFLPDA